MNYNVEDLDLLTQHIQCKNEYIKRLEKENKELRINTDVGIQSWVSVKKAYGKKLSENQELRDRVEEVEDVNERILNSNYNLEGYIRGLIQTMRKANFFLEDSQNGKKVPMPIQICLKEMKSLLQEYKSIK